MLKKTLQTLALLACCQLAFAAPGQAAPATDTPAAAQADEDAWVARLTAWADEFQIPEKDLPRNKEALRNLRKLDLDRLQKLDLDRVPSDNRNLPKITRLPPEIGQLQQLKVLELRGNQLSILPPEIGQLQQLWLLGLRGNQLSALPAEISQLQHLQELGLGLNQFSTVAAGSGRQRDKYRFCRSSRSS